MPGLISVSLIPLPLSVTRQALFPFNPKDLVHGVQVNPGAKTLSN